MGSGVTSGWSGPRSKIKRKPKSERYAPGGFLFDIRMVGSEVQEKTKAKSRKVFAKRFWCDIRVVGPKVQDKAKAKIGKMCARRVCV